MPSPQRKRLDSWKAIGEYLGRNVRTVTRWAEQRDLPVHRVPGGRRQSIFAYSDEIDAWLLDRRASSTEGPTNGPTAGLTQNGKHPQSSPLRNSAKRIGKLAWVAVAVAAFAGGSAWVANTLIEGHHYAAASVPLQFVQLTTDGRAKEYLRTDGRMFYFDESEGVERAAFSLPKSGGQPHRITMNVQDPIIQDVSKDGKRLLVESTEGTEMEHSLWVVPSNGGTARQLSALTCEMARWSPDNGRIACVNGTSIIIANADGTQPRTLVSLGSVPLHLAWTPDGKRLIFVLDQFGDPAAASAWEVAAHAQADGSPPTPRALPWGKDCCVNWAWDESGKQLLFLRIDAEGQPILGEMSALNAASNSDDQARLPVAVGKVMEVRADNDKNLIYLLIEGPSQGEVLKVGPTSTAYKVVLPGLLASDIAYSEDGQWMTYVNQSDQTLWRSRSDGTDGLQLTKSPTSVDISSWSPDGSTIAYLAKSSDGPWRIFLVGRDGSRRREATPDEENSQGGPSWSPDGKKLIYANTLCQQTQTCWIHEIDLETGKVTRLPGSHGLRTARFSPSGRYIAALQPEKHEVVLFDVRKKTWRTLAASVTGDNINWSRDSQFIFTDSPRLPRPIIEKIRVADGRRVTVADFAPLERMPGTGSPWFGLAPDGSPILLHLYNPTEIYALHWKFR